ncbi:glutathione-disulfide reductase [Cucumibacter marinus]|uniref:glutathione-disulfide reductase n=1 Tax=Cucumibacter marinus TaxID=1121252 RepID=UPI00040EFD3B|nr:glutathione-disulfide reductase [Cucumibacter marinus]
MAFDYDLVVIGGGSGGVRAARMAATYGARVLLAEEYRLGGTCVIRGCVPKKLFVYASRFKDMFEVAPAYGWQTDARFDWRTLLENKDREIARLEGIYGSLLDNAGVTVKAERALVTGPNAVRLVSSGEEVSAERILIATGGRPSLPEIEGIELGISSNEAFHLEELPEAICVVGGGYIAVEFASIFAGLGVKTTLAYRGEQILRGFDQDIREMVTEGMAQRGIEIKLNLHPAALRKTPSGAIEVTCEDGSRSEYGAVMFATGRRPNVEGLGLQAVGVDLALDGSIRVNDRSQSNVPSIYAVGDVTGRAQLTPVAIREGAAFAETEFNSNPTTVDHSIIPTAVFSEPEVGTVGMTEEEASKAYDEVNVYMSRFRPMINTLTDRPEKMLLKLITRAGDEKVLGVHIVGPGAGEMIQLAGIPVTMGATKADFDRTIAVHPTAAEELVTLKQPTHKVVNGLRQ